MNGGEKNKIEKKKNHSNSIVLLQEDLKTIKITQNFKGKDLNTGLRRSGYKFKLVRENTKCQQLYGSTANEEKRLLLGHCNRIPDVTKCC